MLKGPFWTLGYDLFLETRPLHYRNWFGRPKWSIGTLGCPYYDTIVDFLRNLKCAGLFKLVPVPFLCRFHCAYILLLEPFLTLWFLQCASLYIYSYSTFLDWFANNISFCAVGHLIFQVIRKLYNLPKLFVLNNITSEKDKSINMEFAMILAR